MLKPLAVATLAGLGAAVVLTKYWGRWRKIGQQDIEENVEETAKERKEEEGKHLEWTMETAMPFSDGSWAVRSTEDEEGRAYLIVKREHEPLPYVLVQVKDGAVDTRFYRNFAEIQPRPPREPMTKISTVMEFHSFLSNVEAS